MDNSLIWKPSDSAREIMSREQVTPVELRDVLVECFAFAHGDAEIALLTLKKQANDIAMSWDEPDKAGLERLIVKLEIVARSFRNPETIQRNKAKFIAMLGKCDCD